MSKFKKEVEIFKNSGGLLRTSQALKNGIHPRNFYAMKKEGVIKEISRGLYHLSAMPQLSNPDVVATALKIPHGIICLISALAFHGITTQVPHEVFVALEKGVKKPIIDYPPIDFVWISKPSFTSGIESHKVDGVNIKIYSPEKTVADCFKFRNKIGLDIAIEALKLCREKKRSKVDTLMQYAKIDRMERIMKPYLEAIL